MLLSLIWLLCWMILWLFVQYTILYHILPMLLLTWFLVCKACLRAECEYDKRTCTHACAQQQLRFLSVQFEHVGGWGAAKSQLIGLHYMHVHVSPPFLQLCYHNFSRYVATFIICWHLWQGNHMVFFVLKMLLNATTEEEHAIRVHTSLFPRCGPINALLHQGLSKYIRHGEKEVSIVTR